jgi:hypothetical protein
MQCYLQSSSLNLNKNTKNGKQNKFNPNDKAAPAHLQASSPHGTYDELHINGSGFFG